MIIFSKLELSYRLQTLHDDSCYRKVRLESVAVLYLSSYAPNLHTILVRLKHLCSTN